MEVSKKHLNTYACTLLCLDLMVNYMEDLKDTPFFKQGIKNKCNSLMADVETVLKADFPKIYQSDERYIVNCMNRLEELVKELSSLHSGEIIEFTQILHEYKKDKEAFLSKHELMLKKLNS